MKRIEKKRKLVGPFSINIKYTQTFAQPSSDLPKLGGYGDPPTFQHWECDRQKTRVNWLTRLARLAILTSFGSVKRTCINKHGDEPMKETHVTLWHPQAQMWPHTHEQAYVHARILHINTCKIRQIPMLVLRELYKVNWGFFLKMHGNFIY